MVGIGLVPHGDKQQAVHFRFVGELPHILKKVPGHLTHRCEVFIVGNRNRDDNGIRNAMFPVFMVNL